MEDSIPSNQPSPLTPVLVTPSSQTNPMATLTLGGGNPVPGGTPAAEPLYSSVIPRSQREDKTDNSLLQTMEATTQPQTQRVSPRASPAPSQSRPKSSSSEGVSTVNLRIRYLEQMVGRLDGEKKAMEEEFGRQRKKFMQEMLQAESQTNLAKDSIARHVKEIEQLNLKLMHMESNKSLGNGNGQELEALKTKLQELSHEQSVKTEQLRKDWLQERKNLEVQVAQLKAENKSLKTAANKKPRSKPTSRDRSKSPNRNRPEGRAKSPSLLVPSGGDTPDDQSFLLSTTTPTVNFSSESSLESSMLEAAKESQLLRTVVVPLEEEIDMLKVQLREAQERLEIYEESTPGNIGRNMTTSPLPTTTTTTAMASTNNEDITEKELLEKLLNQEREARHDLEMHADGLRRQKTVLLSDINEMKQKLQDNQNELKTLQDSYETLQKTFTDANVEFAQTQEAMQQRMLELQHKVHADEATEEHRLQGIFDLAPTKATPTGRFHGNRTRSLSWSSSLAYDTVDCGTVVGNGSQSTSNVSLKPMVEQLQKLMVGLRRDLDSKDTMVAEYQQQLERVQGQLMQDIDQKDDEIERIKRDHDKMKASLIRERKQRDELRRQLVSEKETMKLKIEQFQTNENKMKQKLKSVKDRFTEFKHGTQKEMTQFTDERVKLTETLDHKQEEYDCLKGVHESEIMEYKQQLAKLKELGNEAEMNVASAMDELSKVREKEAQTQARLNQETSEAVQKLSQAEMEKKTLTDQLSDLQNDLIEIQKVNNKLEKECNTLRASRSVIQEKSKAFIEEQQNKLTLISAEKSHLEEEREHLSQEKSQLEETVQNQQTQLSQLKQQLASCEANQKDFVELSQTLQVRLAEIEDNETTPSTSTLHQPLPQDTNNLS